MSADTAVELELEVQVQDTTPEDLDAITRNLLKELRETDVESVKLISTGTAPEGSKSGEAITIGMLAIEILPAALPGLFDLIKAWMMRGQGRTVKFRGRGIEFEGSPEELHKLLQQLDKKKKK